MTDTTETTDAGTGEVNESLAVITTEEAALAAIKEHMVDPDDTLELHFDEVPGMWHLLRLGKGSARPRHLCQGRSFDEVLEQLKMTIHPKASRDRVERRRQKEWAARDGGPDSMAERSEVTETETETAGE